MITDSVFIEWNNDLNLGMTTKLIGIQSYTPQTVSEIQTIINKLQSRLNRNKVLVIWDTDDVSKVLPFHETILANTHYLNNYRGLDNYQEIEGDIIASYDHPDENRLRARVIFKGAEFSSPEYNMWFISYDPRYL